MTSVTSTNASFKPAYSSRRTILGFVIGVAVWFILVLLYNRTVSGASLLSILLTMVISNTYLPRHNAGLAACVGFFAGLAMSVKLFLQSASDFNFITMIIAMAFSGVLEIGFAVIFALIGYYLGHL